VSASHPSRPADAPVSTLRHRVPFYETDAMAIVHHANYLHLLERARVVYLDEHDLPYRDYVAQGMHFAVTRVDIRYRRSARFDDRVEVDVWIEWARGASIGIAYELRCGDELLATAVTEHAMVDDTGRPTRIPRERRANLQKVARRDAPA